MLTYTQGYNFMGVGYLWGLATDPRLNPQGVQYAKA